MLIRAADRDVRRIASRDRVACGLLFRSGISAGLLLDDLPVKRGFARGDLLRRCEPRIGRANIFIDAYPYDGTAG